MFDKLKNVVGDEFIQVPTPHQVKVLFTQKKRFKKLHCHICRSFKHLANTCPYSKKINKKRNKRNTSITNFQFFLCLLIYQIPLKNAFLTVAQQFILIFVIVLLEIQTAETIRILFQSAKGISKIIAQFLL